MYSRFLAEAGRPEAEMCADAARKWTDLADALREASELDRPNTNAWLRVAEAAASVLEVEERLWPALAEASGPTR
jgi:hypothetical protein